MTATAPPRLDMLFIGAPKCGTTWLTRRLARHPALFMPDDEIHYYARYYDKGADWYASHFVDAQPGQKLAENSNSYLTEASALPRIVAEQPQAKLLCLLRNPIERAYSSYGMQVDRGRANDDIALYLDPARSPRPHILSNGLYADLLRPWYDHFSADKFFIGRFDDIRTSPEELYRSVLRFLEVDENFLPAQMHERENARKQEGLPGPLKRMLWWARPLLDGPLRPIAHGPLGRSLQKAASRPKSYPPLTQSLRERLSEYYRADLEELGRMTGARFTDWLDPPTSAT